jgi:transcriptional regulator with XRE-family HTH domain
MRPENPRLVEDLPTRLADGAAAVALGAVIRTARAGRYTLAALASRAGISTGLLSLIERGSGNPSFTTLIRIATALDMEPAALVAAATAGASFLEPDRAAVAAPVRAIAASGAVMPPDGSPWQTQMVLRDGQEASVVVRDGALELSMRDVTADFQPAGALGRLSVDISLTNGQPDRGLALPPADDPRWLDVVRGRTAFKPSSVACSMLFTHVVRCTTQDPSSANVHHWVSELRGCLIASGDPVQPALREVFGWTASA